MLEGGTGLAIYLALKLGGYVAWSAVGARWLGPSQRPLATAAALGVLRLAIGWMSGLLVAPLAIAAVQADRVPVFYFTALVLVRWFEWGLIGMLMPRQPRTAATFAAGASTRGRFWRLGGIAVSYLADAPFLLAAGFPRGRLFC
jgi:hypothetical protein